MQVTEEKINLLIPSWPVKSHILACTTLRGVVKEDDEYASFNLALHVNDKEEQVLNNRRTLRQALHLNSEPIWLEQVHSDDVLNINTVNPTQQALQYDASYTTLKNKVCAIMTADCMPIIVTDKEGRGVAAIHAGWRGLYQGIISKTLYEFVNALSLKYQDCIVWLGPAISQKHFTVGDEVYNCFAERFSESSDFDNAFIQDPQAENKFLCDLYNLARIELKTLGVNEIYGGEHCTYAQDEDYFSFRRSSHQQNPSNCGRMATLVWMV